MSARHLSIAGLLILSSQSAIAHATGPDAPAAKPVEPEIPSEIVVNGKRVDRQAEVQRTPSSITTLSGDTLAAQGITNVRDLGATIPNLFQTRTAVSYLNTTFYVRGVGEPDAQGEPSVPVYIDGVYIPKTLGSQSELLDVERIDAYRGPQGQAFGHAAAGGAITIATTVPGETPTLRAQVGIGNYNDVRYGVAASGSIATGVFGGVAASYHRRDGFDRNVTVGRDVNDVDYLAGRAKLRFVPDDRFDILLTVGGVRDRSTVRGVQDLLRGTRDVYNRIFPANRYDQFVGSLRLGYRIDDHLSVTSLTAAYGFDQDATFDNTGDLYGRGSQIVRYTDRTYSHELKLQGHYSAVDFTTGVYLYREEWFTNRRANTAAAPSTSVPSAIRYRPVYTLIQQDTDNVAAFGEVAVRPTDRLTLTGGLRYNYETHSNDNQLYNLVATAPFQSTIANFLQVLNGPPQALVWSVDVKDHWATWAPKFAIDYRWRSGLTTYATISRGTKSAGYDYRAQTASDAGRRQASTPYDPEKVTNYEIGVKSEWLDGRLRANLSAFYIDFADVQITATDPAPPDGGGPITRRFNAGQASSRGVEFEATAIPVPSLRIDVSGSYLRARLDNFSGTSSQTRYAPNAYFPGGLVLNNAPFDGAVLAYSPKWQGRIAGSWTLPVKTAGSWTLTGDVQYQSGSFTDATNNFNVNLPAQTYANAQLAYTTADTHWSAALSVRNLTNAQYALPPGYAADTAGLPVYRTTNYNDPRTVLLTLSYRR